MSSNGEFPLYLRVIKNRKTSQVSLKIKVKEELWDAQGQRVKKAHPNSARYNSLISTKKAEYDGMLVDLLISGKGLDQNQLNIVKGKQETDFFSYSEEFLKNASVNKRYGYYRRMYFTIEKFKTFHNNRKLPFTEINVSFLKEFENYLIKKLDNKPNTVHSNFKVIRAIYNSARSEGLIKDTISPFDKYMVKTINTERAYLTEEELDRLIQLEVKGNLKLHRDMFVFACYAGGLRVSDILQLQWKNFDGTHIIKNTQKTRTTVSIKLTNRSMLILKEYSKRNEKEEDFIFPVLKSDFLLMNEQYRLKLITSSTSYINKNLKELAVMSSIEKNLSFHVSRHTFGTMALRKGMRIEYVSKLMGHSSIIETQTYAKIVSKDLDDAMNVFDD